MIRQRFLSIISILLLYLVPSLTSADEESNVLGSLSRNRRRRGQQQRDPPKVLLQYDFTRESCFDGVFPNVKSNNLLPLSLHRNGNTTTCSLGLGVESQVSMMSTSRNPATYLDTSSSDSRSQIEEFFNIYKVSKRGISIELWLNPFIDEKNQNEDDKLRPILAYGHSDSTNVDTPNLSRLTDCDIQQVDLLIAQRGNAFEVIFRNSDKIFEPCTRFRLVDYPIRQGQMNHIAVALGKDKQQITVNGQASPVLTELFDGDLRHWNSNDVLYLFSHPKIDSRAVWNGRIFQLLVYEGFLTVPYIRSNLAVDFPSSKPYAISRTVTMNEDAELVPGSHDIAWYNKARVYGDGDFPEITLRYGFIENDMLEFLEDIGMPPRSRSDVFIFITRLPSKGSMHQPTDGKQLANNSGTALPINDGVLVYIPVHNEHSMLPGTVYSSFDYCVSENVTYMPKDCDDATVYVVVNPVDDPPIPVALPDNIVVMEGTLLDSSKPIQLTGFDVDSADSIRSIQITENPKFGHLILSVSTFRPDGLLHGAPIASLNNLILGQTAFVEYRFDGSGQLLRNGTTTDSFKFRALDSTSLWSTEKSVSINVEPGVVGIPQAPTNLLEDSIGLIKLRGKDISGLRRTIGYILDTIPPDGEGKLLDSTNFELSEGSVVRDREEFPYVHGAAIVFWPSSDYCTNKSARDSMLTYHVAAFVDEKMTSLSSPIVHSMHIECLPDPLNLTGPSQTFEIQPFDESYEGPCNGYFFNSTEIKPELCKMAAVVSGLNVTSRDSHSLLAHVSISASRGLLTLNRNHWDEILPLEGQEEVRGTIRFLALPKRLNDVLSYLYYQSDVYGEDKIIISIQYPNGCNVSDAYCQVLSHEIPVVVVSPRHVSRKMYLFRGFQWVPVPFTLLMLLLITLKGRAREKLIYAGNQGDDGDPDSHAQLEEPVADASLGEDIAAQKNAIPTMEETGNVRTDCWIRHFDEKTGRVTWEARSETLFVEGDE